MKQFGMKTCLLPEREPKEKAHLERRGTAQGLTIGPSDLLNAAEWSGRLLVLPDYLPLSLLSALEAHLKQFDLLPK